MDYQQLHFVLFPLMAPGHMIPLMDVAKLLAQRGVFVTVISTTRNAERFSATVTRAQESGLKIQVIPLRFPSQESGLPEGCENLDMLPSMDMVVNFFAALNMLQEQVTHLFEELKPRPSCLISDMGLPWTTQVAAKFGVPRIVFHGTCCFSLLCSHNIVSSKILDSLNSDWDGFEVPNVPHQIKLRKLHVSSATNKDSSAIKNVTEQIRAAEKTSYGVVVNSFHELESEYAELYRRVKGEKVWLVGPVSLCNKETIDMVDRGNQSSLREEDCLKWLDLQKEGSVIYASLGSLSRLITSQMIELALGLEASNRPFVWSLGGGGGDKSGEVKKWIKESGFEERVKGWGLIITGWAPQVLILSHSSIGGFLTHAGWNSTLEGITAGVPMVTWPLFAEQFVNEKLVVEVLRIGVSIGVEKPVKWGEEEKVGVLVKKEDVKKSLDLLMDDDENGRERRRKAREIGEMAKRATEGGSSHQNIEDLIEEIRSKSNLGLDSME